LNFLTFFAYLKTRNKTRAQIVQITLIVRWDPTKQLFLLWVFPQVFYLPKCQIKNVEKHAQMHTRRGEGVKGYDIVP
jgi:hypothetical protein